MVRRHQAWHDITAFGHHTQSGTSALRYWTTRMVGRHRAWHDITPLGQHTRSDYVEHGMTSPPLDSTHDRTTSGVTCQYRLWATHTVERRRAWHAITALGQHIQSKDVKRGMTSPPLDNTHGRTTSGVTCHHRLWTAHTIERRWAWHAIITFGQHKRSDGVGRGMPLSPLDGKHGRTMSGVECHHLLWAVGTVDIIGCGMSSWPLDTTHDRTKSVVACHHSP